MSTFSQFAGGGGGIKSIQRGTATLTSVPSVSSLAITISSVNTAKSELRLLGLLTGSATAVGNWVTIKLTNATTITAERASADTGVTISWELTEWN